MSNEISLTATNSPKPFCQMLDAQDRYSHEWSAIKQDTESAIVPAARTRTTTALGFQPLLRTRPRPWELLHDQGGHADDIVQAEQRHVQIRRGLSDTTASSPSVETGISPICSRTITIFGYPFVFPSFGNDQVVGVIEKPIPHVFDMHLIRHIGKHRHTPFESTITLLAPARLWRQLSFPSVSRSNPCPACFTVATL